VHGLNYNANYMRGLLGLPMSEPNNVYVRWTLFSTNSQHSQVSLVRAVSLTQCTVCVLNSLYNCLLLK